MTTRSKLRGYQLILHKFNMNKEINLWQFVAKQLKINEKVMLLVVVESNGSSPGRQGFKMVINTDGTSRDSREGVLQGSIGGGIMEIKLVELAKDCLQKGLDAPFFKKQIHNKNAAHDQSGMICSGEQTILFYTLKKTDLPTVRRIVFGLKNGLDAVLKMTHSYLQVFENQKLNAPFNFLFIDEASFVVTENLGFKNELYIIGGGHCALALSELMSKMDFRIHLFDDRSDLNTLEKNKFVHQKQLVDYDKMGKLIPSGNNVYVVIMTVGYRTDAVVLRQLLEKNVRYLGVLGSAAKMKTLLQELKNEGFSDDILRGIHTPIGLDINSQTPEEIAVSIAAEMIKVKNNGGATFGL
jgi:xanthine dehydrogenase accessory factor